MKKSILTLLVLFVCAIQTATAYEYFTIYFSDGTKSEAFYATDVDSICYSKLSLDSIVYDDWQVQEIYTCDSVYRYSLAQIDSLIFKDVDENKVAEDIANVSEAITPLFTESSSPITLSEHIAEIQNLSGVEDAYLNNQTLYIKIRDWGYVSFYFPIDDFDKADDELNLAPLSQNMKVNVRRSNENEEHKYTEVLKACVVNQQYYDEKRKSFKDIANQFKVSFESIGINADIKNMPSLDFFKNDMFDYDILFIKTHGDYDEKTDLHWLCTGEELWSYNPSEISVGDVGKLLNVKLPLWLKHGYSPKKVSFMCIKEKRGGDFLHIYYTTISDEFIRSAKRKFRNVGSAIVFNTACESMMKNNKMAKAFEERGVGCYLGYDDSNSVGGTAGKNLFAHLLVGKSTQSAYNAIPDWCKEQTIYEDEDGLTYETSPSGKKYNKYNPKLKDYPPSICITHPETLSAEKKPEGEKMSTVLKGCLKRANIPGAFGNTSVGFQYSIYSDMSQAKSIKVQGNYDSSTLYMNWEAILNEKDLQPNTTYYYRAYMNDGYSNCYGEIKSFTTKDDNAIAYYVWDEASKTATYYFDGMLGSRVGWTISISNKHHVPYNAVNVIFDNSFSNYYPHRFRFNECYKLRRIENICYLKTDSIDSMADMFCWCESLTSLDLSTFNTSNLTSISGMFGRCSSLTSLDLSNFNTSNVTDMGYMFYGCSSLTNLDLSSFNTSNVTSMEYMFCGCDSLTSLDLSSFNTSNVTYMGCMFSGCSSLASLDLRSFNTSNVTKMGAMFVDCSSLTSLDLSNFNTSNVTSMRNMFYGCNSLTSLDLSSFNTSNVTSMDHMFDGCSSLTSLDLSSFNTSNVTILERMFSHCTSLKTIYANNWYWNRTYLDDRLFGGLDNLVGGKGTHIGSNLYGYDNNGQPLYYYCPVNEAAAHIDGGKDNPGLFTAK